MQREVWYWDVARWWVLRWSSGGRGRACRTSFLRRQMSRLLLLGGVECAGEEADKEQRLRSISEGMSKCINILMPYLQHFHSWLRQQQQGKTHGWCLVQWLACPTEVH